MSIATIVLDDESGAVACKLTFGGGYNKASGAHQAAQILIKLMDQHMAKIGAAVIDPVIANHNLEPTQGEQAVAALMALKAKADRG